MMMTNPTACFSKHSQTEFMIGTMHRTTKARLQRSGIVALFLVAVDRDRFGHFTGSHLLAGLESWGYLNPLPWMPETSLALSHFKVVFSCEFLIRSAFLLVFLTGLILITVTN